MKIKGVNLGGWLLMEGYILGGRNIAEFAFKRSFREQNGNSALVEFEKLFRNNFITKTDFANIRLMGANAVRVPFNHKLIESQAYKYSEKGFRYLDNVMSWAKYNKLGVILDLHAACGSQNHDWHSDSTGKALLWLQPDFRKRTYALWSAIAARYKDCPSLIGYDVLNEPVIDKSKVGMINDLYIGIIKAIRAHDKEHTIFLEGNIWAQQIDFLSKLISENVTISIHTYCPLNFTFNFVPCLNFPGKIEGDLWNQQKLFRYLEPYRKFAEKYDVRLLVGEFGINWRGGHFGELKWLDGILKSFDKFGFDYTYWTYKAIANSAFPDGIYQYLGNNAYVRREGPVYGFENYVNLWKRENTKIVDFWKTDNFAPNKKLISVLKKHFSKN